MSGKKKRKEEREKGAGSLYPPRLSPTSHSYRVIVFRPSGSELDCWLHSFGSPAISIMNNHKDPLYTTHTRCSQYLCSVQPTRTLTLYQCYLCILTPLHESLSAARFSSEVYSLMNNNVGTKGQSKLHSARFQMFLRWMNGVRFNHIKQTKSHVVLETQTATYTF